MYHPFEIRAMRSGEAINVAHLIFESTNRWYSSHGLGRIFQGRPEDCLVFCEVYEDLDPGCCLIAVRRESAVIVGSCFYHPRNSHVSLGIMNTAPDSGCKGVARALVEEIARIAAERELPLRLVSSAFNLDSFSLYTRCGFAPYAVYQDMTMKVPESGISVSPVPGLDARPATMDDMEGIVALEAEIWGVSRRKDWIYFLENQRGIWSVTVAVDGKGETRGAIASVRHPGSNLLGPGIATDSVVAALLIQTELNQHRGRSPVFLIPSLETKLVASMYAMGARNCELHVAQSLGPPPLIRGIVFPTFMPETG